jgi:transcriptional regulator with XRE-family HTH domain
MQDKAIGKRIQQYREAKGYTQESFAEIVKLTPNYLSAIERGVKTPSVDTLIEIINSLGVSADEILMDVINAGYKIKASKLSEEIGNLPQDEQKRIFSVVEALVKEAKTR